MLELVAARLKGQCGLKTVGEALDLASIVAVPASPAAFVIPISDQAPPTARVNGIEQAVTETFGVVLILRSAATAADRAVTFDGLRDDVVGLLLGWVPNPACTPIQYVGGAMIDVTPNEVRRLIKFSTRYLIRSNP